MIIERDITARFCYGLVSKERGKSYYAIRGWDTH